jgi:hypothetical protein
MDGVDGTSAGAEMRKRWLGLASALFVFACGDYSNTAGDPATGGAAAGGTLTGGAGGGSGAGGSGAGGIGMGGDSSGGSGAIQEPGTEVALVEPAARVDERARLDADLDAVANLDADSLRERYPAPFEQAPTYEPSAIAGLDRIQGSPLSLTNSELSALVQKGFVLSGSRAFPTFGYGYSTIYMADLPVYISADSILEGVHRSYDRVLEELESEKLEGELGIVLSGMRERLASGVGSELSSEVRADTDVFLGVALSLLEGRVLAPVAGGSAEAIEHFVELANAASGTADIVLFGVRRADEDFSQFQPRGHYTEGLAQYFRAMIWLGRVDFRLFETQPNGTRLFHRRQLEGVLLLNELVDTELRPHFDAIDRVVTALVGEPDYMELADVSKLLEDVGVSSLADVASVSDQTFAQAIVDGGYGLQRIASHVMTRGLAADTLPLSLAFAFLGQRYVIDSHVFSNVVYDRVLREPLRMMPKPLDVAFAVLGNDQAAALLAPELATHSYAPDLAAMRVLAERHPPEFWRENLYNLWLGSLRELSPAAIARGADVSALPATFRSEAWGRRLLQTELASWAELRHDTVLYAKQSYTSPAACEFPDGYVEPYPEFFAKLGEYAARGREMMADVAAGTTTGERATRYFDRLATISARLRDMATYQRSGAPYTQEMLDFINDAVTVSINCDGTPIYGDGWYGDLYFEQQDSVTWSPTVADVHTQPTDEFGAPVGRVLHVGTGDARLMVVVADTCSGPRAYVGLASSYHEHITSHFERLDDQAWATMVRDEPDVPWAADLVTR